jgi:RES domain-containing protein
LIAEAHMIDGWDERPISKISQAIGDQWIKEGLSAILRVPSVIMPDGHNYLMNIHHPDFKKIKIGKPLPLAFDPRLKK